MKRSFLDLVRSNLLSFLDLFFLFLLFFIVALVNLFHAAIAEIDFRVTDFLRIVGYLDYNVIGHTFF